MNKATKHPQLARTCVNLPAILKHCAKRPRTYDQLEKLTGTTRGTLHVQVMQLRDRGLLEAIDGGTIHVQHRTTAKGLAPSAGR